jgi:hypothetical protein
MSKRVDRFYDIFGQEFRSVTTVTNRLKKYGLENWQASEAVSFVMRELVDPLRRGWMTKEQLEETDLERMKAAAMDEARRKRDAAADKGRLIHRIIHEYYRTGQDLKVLQGYARYDPGTSEALEAFQTWEKDYSVTPIWTEHEVYHIERRYAGTLDLYAEIILPSEKFSREDDRRRRYVIDFKSGQMDIGSVMQVAAYAMAVEAMENITVDGAAIVLLDQETGKPKWKGYSRESLGLPSLMFRKILEFCELEDRVSI